MSDPRRARGAISTLVVALVLVGAACSNNSSLGEDSSPDTESVTVRPESALPDLEGRPVLIGSENAYLPFSFVPDDESEPQGWDRDVWNELCRLLNCFPKFVSVARSGVSEQLVRGDVDVVANGIAITEARQLLVEFSDPYLTVRQTFIVRADDTRFAQAADIIDSNATVGTQSGTTNFDIGVELLGGDERIWGFDRFGFAMYALIDGDVDAVLIDDAAALGYLAKHEGRLSAVDAGLAPSQLGFAFALESDLVDPVNLALIEMATSGALDDINERHFGREFATALDG